MKRRGFTILELLVVIAIIAILATIVVRASSAAIKSARENQTNAMRIALQTAIESYKAADSGGNWPRPIEQKAASGTSGKLTESDAQVVFQMIVQKSTGESGNPVVLIDPYGLIVAPSGKSAHSKGLSFGEARRGTKTRRKLAVANMVFGYRHKNSGRFHPFNIVYEASSDSVTVSTHCYQCLSNTGGCTNGDCPNCHRE